MSQSTCNNCSGNGYVLRAVQSNPPRCERCNGFGWIEIPTQTIDEVKVVYKKRGRPSVKNAESYPQDK